MVEYSLNLNSVFAALADPTRRDILKRVAKKQLSIGEIARPYKLTFAAVSKHLVVLGKAKLIVKHRRGKQQIVVLSPSALQNAEIYIRYCENIWNTRFDRLDKLLKEEISARGGFASGAKNKN